MTRFRPLALAAAFSLVLPAATMAQGNPSADQIIRSLQPTGPLAGTSRGIRPLTPSAPAAAPGRPGAQAGGERAAAAAPARPSVDLTVQFANGSAELTPQAVRTLTELGRALSSQSLGSYRFRIEGHTDTVGSAESNKVLSEHRAQAVVTFLVSRFKIDQSRLDAVGMGEDGLIVQTPPDTAEPRNRRVQIINLGA